MQIHSQEEPPAIDQLGFGAAPGHQTFVSCQQQQVFWFISLYLSPSPNSYPSPEEPQTPSHGASACPWGPLPSNLHYPRVSVTLSPNS